MCNSCHIESVTEVANASEQDRDKMQIDSKRGKRTNRQKKKEKHRNSIVFALQATAVSRLMLLFLNNVCNNNNYIGHIINTIFFGISLALHIFLELLVTLK